jgi:hypothetical protein
MPIRATSGIAIAGNSGAGSHVVISVTTLLDVAGIDVSSATEEVTESEKMALATRKTMIIEHH